MNSEERWVGVEVVAAHLQVAKESIYRWIDSKEFPAHRVGRLLRFKLSEVDTWVTKGEGLQPRHLESRRAAESTYQNKRTGSGRKKGR